MFRGKEIHVVFSEEARESFDELNKVVGEEIKKDIMASVHQTLLKSINRAKELLRENPFAGIQIPKSRIPRKYLLKYNVTNLWKINLSDFWRIVYTATGNQVEIMAFVLDIVDHKTYDKIFGYKGK
ncbi:MAG: hypothetical protein V1886_00615 [archaeon]